MKIEKEIEKLKDKEVEYRKKAEKLIKREMNKFKGRYFLTSESDISHIKKKEIFEVLDENWENVLCCKRSYFCKDTENEQEWGDINQEFDFEFSFYGYKNILRCQELTKEEYKEHLEQIGILIKDIEIRKLNDKIREIKKQKEQLKKEKKQ